MLERLGRLCVGVGLLWVLLIVAVGLVGGLDKPEILAPYLDGMLGPDLRQVLYLGLTFLVVPIGMLMVLRDMLGDPEPLWLKLAAPGVFLAVYVLFLAAAAPRVGQPVLLAVDPLVTQVLPAASLTGDPGDGHSWLARFAAMLALVGVVPGVLGYVVGLLAGDTRKH